MFKFGALFAFENLLHSTVGPLYRKIGQNLIFNGLKLQGSMTSDDRLVRNLTQVYYNTATPQISEASFVAPNSVLVGSIELDQNSAVWYGATLRGDRDAIRIGRNSQIQDNCTLIGTTVAHNVYVGPNVTLGKCVLDSDAFVGMGSMVSDGAVVQGVVAAGSVVGKNENVYAGQVWAGSPAKYLRDITPEELQILREHKQEISQLAMIHSEENIKAFRDVLDDRDELNRKKYLTAEQAAYEQLAKLNFPLDGDDEEFIEHRVFLKEKPYFDENDENQRKRMDPYEQDLEHFPENFKIYQEDYEIYDNAKRFFEENPSAQATAGNVARPTHPTRDEPWSRKY